MSDFPPFTNTLVPAAVASSCLGYIICKRSTSFTCPAPCLLRSRCAVRRQTPACARITGGARAPTFGHHLGRPTTAAAPALLHFWLLVLQVPGPPRLAVSDLLNENRLSCSQNASIASSPPTYLRVHLPTCLPAYLPTCLHLPAYIRVFTSYLPTPTQAAARYPPRDNK
eukprot:9504039-Pyramimonas_sp.AAC.2